MTHAPTRAGIVPPPELVQAARRYVDTVGLARAVDTLGASRQSLAALLAGLRVRRGTVLLVARGLGWPGTPDSSRPPPAA